MSVPDKTSLVFRFARIVPSQAGILLQAYSCTTGLDWLREVLSDMSCRHLMNAAKAQPGARGDVPPFIMGERALMES